MDQTEKFANKHGVTVEELCIWADRTNDELEGGLEPLEYGDVIVLKNVQQANEEKAEKEAKAKAEAEAKAPYKRGFWATVEVGGCAAAGAVIGACCTGPVGAGVGAGIGAAVGAVGAVLHWLGDNAF